jgi:hypothetical protein
VNALAKRVNSPVFARLPPRQARQLNASVAAVRARHHAIRKRILRLKKARSRRLADALPSPPAMTLHARRAAQKLLREKRVQKRMHTKIVKNVRAAAAAAAAALRAACLPLTPAQIRARAAVQSKGRTLLLKAIKLLSTQKGRDKNSGLVCDRALGLCTQVAAYVYAR